MTGRFYTLAREQGKKKVAWGRPEETGIPARGNEPGGTLNSIPERMPRIAAAGLSGFPLTEEAIRKALACISHQVAPAMQPGEKYRPGNTLPEDGTDLAADQSERAREITAKNASPESFMIPLRESAKMQCSLRSQQGVSWMIRARTGNGNRTRRT
jgi:hypothetical protein